jgi:2-polyprenyl-3-methyl-5-hydroxy-6-metoxy-1,4-benzoquinol methylase
MNSSQKTIQFYKELTAEGLMNRTNKKWSEQIINDIKNKISKKHKILDVGCGYGRISVPLAMQGYNISGVDISSNLIASAKKYAKKEKVKINFKIGDMCKLNYKESSFDRVLCLWTAFNELLMEKEQISCVKGIYKILNPGGKAIFDCPVYREPTKEDIQSKNAHGKDYRLRITIIDGTKTEHFMHDEKSIENIMKKAGIKNYKIYKEQFGGRERLLFEFTK